MAHSNLVGFPPTIRPELVEGFPLSKSLRWSPRITVKSPPAVRPELVEGFPSPRAFRQRSLQNDHYHKSHPL